MPSTWHVSLNSKPSILTQISISKFFSLSILFGVLENCFDNNQQRNTTLLGIALAHNVQVSANWIARLDFFSLPTQVWKI